jgi:hypothetical protein
MTGCYLFSHKVKLPEWGFEQQEVRLAIVDGHKTPKLSGVASLGYLQQEPYMGELTLVYRDEHP